MLAGMFMVHATLGVRDPDREPFSGADSQGCMDHGRGCQGEVKKG